jgi:hypothetical protein
MRHFKSFTARQIIDLLESRGVRVLLQQLRALKLPHKNESDYQVWQEGNHPQQIRSDDIMRQKIDYIHNNAVLRGYVDDPLDWRHSSACNYAGCPG